MVPSNVTTAPAAETAAREATAEATAGVSVRVAAASGQVLQKQPVVFEIWSEAGVAKITYRSWDG